MINDVEKSYTRLAKLANEHLHEQARFRKLCIKHYGIYWQSLQSLSDEDAIIDTIDYGYGTLDFEDFDRIVQAAIKIDGIGDW